MRLRGRVAISVSSNNAIITAMATVLIHIFVSVITIYCSGSLICKCKQYCRHEIVQSALP